MKKMNKEWKNVKHFIALFLAIPLLNSCFDLEEIPYTSLSPNSFYKNSQELEMGVTGTYRSFRSMLGDRYFGSLEVATEFGSPTNTKWDYPKTNLWIDINNPDITYGPSCWDKGFNVVNSANIVLDRGQGVTMDEQEKERMYGEVRFLRAYANYIMVRLYGALPIPQNYTNGLEGLEIPRKTVAENYAQIIEDLTYASEKLPLKSEYKTEDVWKVSKGAAQALLGDVYLTRGCMENNNEFFVSAEKLLGTVINSDEYQLESNYENLWFWFNTANKNGQESLFELQFGETQPNLVTQYTGCYNGRIPSLGSTHYLRVGPSIEAYMSYDSNDSRRKCMLTEFKDVSGNLVQFDTADKGFYPGNKGWTSSGPGNVKFYDRTESAYLNDCSKANIYMIRYADVLLDYSEAINLQKGPTAEAVAKFNEVRVRAGLNPITPGNATEFADLIYRERGWEFIGEALLYYDELRTNRIGQNVFQHLKEGISEGLYQYKDQSIQFIPQRTFLWKIPTADMNSNPALVQNPDNQSDSRYLQ
jgi:hypothetical protein